MFRYIFILISVFSLSYGLGDTVIELNTTVVSQSDNVNYNYFWFVLMITGLFLALYLDSKEYKKIKDKKND